MFPTRPPRLSTPGLFVTATDTGVGKTLVACAIAHTFRQRGLRVGVCKPFASGCRIVSGRLVSPDAQALQHFAGCQKSLSVINPIRYGPPLAPAVAARECGTPPDYGRLARSLESIDASSDVVLIEGVGGLLVPLDDCHTVLDLVAYLGYPVVVVTRAGLGTLNHTAMTVRLLQHQGCHAAGLVVNHADVDLATCPDPSIATNPQWLRSMNRVPVLATVPACATHTIRLSTGCLPREVHDAVGRAHWPGIVATPRTPDSGR